MHQAFAWRDKLARGSARIRMSHFFLAGGALLPLLSQISPLRTRSAAAQSKAEEPWRCDPTLVSSQDVVSLVCAVSNGPANLVKARLSRRCGNYAMLIVQCDAKASLRQDRFDLALHCHEFPFAKSAPRHTDSHPWLNVFQHGAKKYEMEKGPKTRQSDSVADDEWQIKYSEI